MMMGRSGLRVWAGTVAVGTEHVAGRHAVGTASEFGSGTSAHVLRIVRTRLRFVAAGVGMWWLLLSFCWIQSKHVQKNGGDIRH